MFVCTSGRCIQMVNLDVLSRCFIWVLFVSSFRSCIQMNHQNTSMFVCFSFFNLHLHPGALVNKKAKIFFFYVSAEKQHFYSFGGKIFLWFFKKNVFLTKRCIFCGFGGKYVFMGFTENTFLWVWRKISFCGYGGKCTFCGFDGKCVF